MHIKEFFMNLLEEVIASISRFITTFCFTLLLFLAGTCLLLLDLSGEMEQVFFRIILMSIFGILFCTLGKLLYEKVHRKGNDKHKRLLVDLVCVFMSGLTFFPLKNIDGNFYITMGYVGILFALLFGILYLSITDSISKTFTHLFCKTVFNGTVCSIISAGTSLCFFVFNMLLLGGSFRFDKVYGINLLFIWVVLFLNLSLSIIPHKDTQQKAPVIFKSIVLYAVLPVYLLLLVVLYIYLGKILITFSFPSGQINWIASFASLFFIFFIFSLEQFKGENKLAGFFVRFGGYILIPIIVVQFIAIYIRLVNYGLTTSRFISIALSVIALIFAVVSLIRNCRYIKYMLLAVTGVLLLLTLTPFNVLDMPIRDQTARLLDILSKNNMITEGKIVPNESVSEEDQIKITSSYQYIKDSDAKKPAFIEDIVNFRNTFGFSPKHYGFSDSLSKDDSIRYHFVNNSYSSDNKAINIAEYSAFYFISSTARGNDSAIIAIGKDKKTVNFDLIKALEPLFEQNSDDNNKSKDVKMEFSVGQDKIILTSVTFIVEGNKIQSVYSFSGYYLQK